MRNTFPLTKGGGADAVAALSLLELAAVLVMGGDGDVTADSGNARTALLGRQRSDVNDAARSQFLMDNLIFQICFYFVVYDTTCRARFSFRLVL